MKKLLNIKKMAKDMSLKDKARLLFADHTREFETQGKERLLTPEEEDAITESCQKKEQIPELNRLNSMYNLSGRVVRDVRARMLHLELAMSRLDTVVTYIHKHDEGEEKLRHLTYKLGTTDSVQKLYQEISNQSQSSFNWYSNKIEDGASSDSKKLVPDPHVQRLSVEALDASRMLRRVLHMMECIEQKGDMKFVGEMDEEIMQEAHKLLIRFSQEYYLVPVLNIYKEALDLDLLDTEQCQSSLFLEMVADFQKVNTLTDEDREDAENMVNQCLKDH